ncbi:MAG: hypothetical protein RLP44_29120 [Aggregatilineales bacterium]
MCALYVLGVIASIFGFSFLGISSVETSEGAWTEFSGIASVSATPNMEILTVIEADRQYTFPRQPSFGAERDMMQAELTGTLIEENGCLYVQSDTGGEQYLIIWAPEYSVSVLNDAVIVMDELGAEAVRVGQQVYLGGGEISTNAQADFEAERGLLPIEGCSGQYWIMGDVARPAG